MDEQQLQYYKDMMARCRGSVVTKDGHLAAIITFFVGDDDEKFLLNHEPWQLVDDDAKGETLYIDQFWVAKNVATPRVIYKEFSRFLQEAKKTFTNIKRAKWVRVDANFRKHKITEGVKRHVHCKDIKF